MDVAGRKDALGDEEFDPAVLPVAEEGGRGGELAEERGSFFVVDGAAVVGVDEAEVPELGALVEIGETGAETFSTILRE